MGTCFAKGQTGSQEEAIPLKRIAVSRQAPACLVQQCRGGENGAARAQDASRAEPKLQHPRCAALAKTLVEL